MNWVILEVTSHRTDGKGVAGDASVRRSVVAPKVAVVLIMALHNQPDRLHNRADTARHYQHLAEERLPRSAAAPTHLVGHGRRRRRHIDRPHHRFTEGSVLSAVTATSRQDSWCRPAEQADLDHQQSHSAATNHLPSAHSQWEGLSEQTARVRLRETHS